MISSINLVGGDDAIVKYWDIAFETPLLELLVVLCVGKLLGTPGVP